MLRALLASLLLAALHARALTGAERRAPQRGGGQQGPGEAGVAAMEEGRWKLACTYSRAQGRTFADLIPVMQVISRFCDFLFFF